MENDLRVGVSSENMAPRRFELLPQCAEVIDLSVEYDCETAVLVVDRLMSCRKVNDAEPPHRDAAGLVVELSSVVGSAMGKRRVHLRNRIGERVSGCRGADSTNT